MTIDEVFKAHKENRPVYLDGQACEVVYAETGFGQPSVTVQPINRIGCTPDDLSLTNE